VNERFDVRFFKRLITFTVIAIIAALTIALIVSRVQVSHLRNTLYGKSSILQAVEKNGGSDDPAYMKEYPEMTASPSAFSTKKEKKVVYLTFDDGPSATTESVLDTLEKYHVKATFFLVHKRGDSAASMIRREIKNGNSVGIHTYSHNYKKIYRSVDSYLADYNKMWKYLKHDFNYDAEIFRFPGGSMNSYDLDVFDKIIPEMYRRGFRFYDWNVSAEDATFEKRTSRDIANTIVRDVKAHDKSIVLLHDSAGKDSTAEALPEIIRRLKKAGYEFKTLDSSVRPITFVTYE
jgi:peptidoglycan/xylan/chitin deacetylase (PgdA/CDA1 family)